MITTEPRRERAYLIGVLLPGTSRETVSDQMRELEELTRTAGGEVVESDVQRREQVEPALFVGRGKVAEMRERRADLQYDLVICNEDLSPRQQRNLEKELQIRVEGYAAARASQTFIAIDGAFDAHRVASGEQRVVHSFTGLNQDQIAIRPPCHGMGWNRNRYYQQCGCREKIMPL